MASSATKTQFNRPAFVALLFVLGALSGEAFGLLGLLLAFAWSDKSRAWEATHYVFLMRTFWLALVANIVGVVLVVLHLYLLAAPILVLTALWSLVRAIVSFAGALRRQPIEKPLTYFV